MPRQEAECNGTRVCGSRPVEMPRENSWGVWLTAYSPFCGGAGYHVICSPRISKESLITWAGPLGCFPAETPQNRAVKHKLISENGEVAFFAAVKNPEESHLAQLALNVIEEDGCIAYACAGCPKFVSFREKT